MIDNHYGRARRQAAQTQPARERLPNPEGRSMPRFPYPEHWKPAPAENAEQVLKDYVAAYGHDPAHEALKTIRAALTAARALTGEQS